MSNNLQSVVFSLEMNGTFVSLEELIQAIASTDWAKDERLNEEKIRKQLVKQNVITKFSQASSQDDGSKKKKVTVVKQTSEESKMENFKTLYVATPAGKCPYKLTGKDEDSIFEWCEKIRNNFMQKNEFITVSGLAYFAREFYDVNSSDHKDIKAIIKSLYSGDKFKT